MSNQTDSSPNIENKGIILRDWIYLITNLILGVCYLAFLAFGFSVSLFFSIFAIGLPLLVAMFFATRWLVAFDQQLTANALDLDMSPLPDDVWIEAWWPINKRIAAYIQSPMTTRCITYLFAKFGFGVASAVAAILFLPTFLIEWLMNRAGLKTGFISFRLLHAIACGIADLHYSLIAPPEKQKNKSKRVHPILENGEDNNEPTYTIGDDGELVPMKQHDSDD